MLSLIIPVFNKVELTKRCLDSVLENSRALGEVFVIDNASVDETPEVLKAFQEKFKKRNIRFEILTNPKNLGFGAACNQGVRLARENFIAILNNDTWLMRGWDQALQKEIERLSIDVVGPFVDERPIGENPQAVADEFLRKSGFRSRRHFVPILMFFKREAVEALRLPHGGIFDERFFVTYEDTDLMYRMKQLGLRWAQTSRCYLWHHSMGTRSDPKLLPQGYEQEGLRIFIEKWGFDPRKPDHTWLGRWSRRYRKARAAKGLF